MSWVVIATGTFKNGHPVPPIIGPFMSEAAARRCMFRLAALTVGTERSLLVQPMLSPAKAYELADLAPEDVARWPELWAGQDGAETQNFVQGVVDAARALEPVIRANGIRVTKLDADGQPIGESHDMPGEAAVYSTAPVRPIPSIFGRDCR